MLDASETESASDRTTAERPGVADALRDSARSIVELAQDAGYLLSTKIDQLKLSIRTLILYAVLGVMGVIAAAAVLVVSLVLLFVGVAHGLGAAMGGREWLGDLVVGLIILGAGAISMALLLNKFKMASRRRTVKKYEDRSKEQRERFGR